MLGDEIPQWPRVRDALLEATRKNLWQADRHTILMQRTFFIDDLRRAFDAGGCPAKAKHT